MATHCYTRNQVSKVKIKQLKKILQETLIRQKEKVKLDLLVDAPLRAIQDKDKKPMHDEGPSGEQESNFILIQDDDADVESAQLRMTIQEQNTKIQDLSLNVERAKWIIKYLE